MCHKGRLRTEKPMSSVIYTSVQDSLTHVDHKGKPTMVDVSQKSVTYRSAKAQARVRFPPEVARRFRAAGFKSKKGSVFDVAIVAGTMAVKKTWDIIPFCHQLSVESCKLEIEMNDDVVFVHCEVGVEAKTGVEMEALHGASVAALTVYDMCKALSHDIEIESIKLLQKSGGKSCVG